MSRIVLASKSPRRKELLENIGLKFEVFVTDADESIVSKELAPGDYVCELSKIKAEAAANAITDKNTLVIGADTVVVSEDGQILGKPLGKADAVATLKMLSGRTHSVYTGVTVTGCGHSASSYERTDVTFRCLTDKEINHYVENFTVTDKAGSYGIQEYASIFVKKIEGDYFNIVGLPMCRLATMIYEEYGEELI